MTHTRIVAIITDALCQAASEAMPLIKSPQRQQAGITGDLTARKISANGSVSVEGKRKLWYEMSRFGCSERECWVRENPVFINLLEHLFFFRSQNRE
jgi:hypothetical protein